MLAASLFVRLDIQGVNVIVGSRFRAVIRYVIPFVRSWQTYQKACVNKLKIKWHVNTPVVESDSGIPSD